MPVAVERPSSAGYARPSGVGAGAVGWDAWLEQSRDVAGEVVARLAGAEEMKRLQEEERARVHFRLEAERDLQAVEQLLARGKFADARRMLQKARQGFKTAKVGKEPELRALEGDIDSAEADTIRMAGEASLREAENHLAARRFDQARAKVGEARSAYTRLGFAEGLRRLKEFDQRMQATEWFVQAPAAGAAAGAPAAGRSPSGALRPAPSVAAVGGGSSRRSLSGASGGPGESEPARRPPAQVLTLESPLASPRLAGGGSSPRRRMMPAPSPVLGPAPAPGSGGGGGRRHASPPRSRYDGDALDGPPALFLPGAASGGGSAGPGPGPPQAAPAMLGGRTGSAEDEIAEYQRGVASLTECERAMVAGELPRAKAALLRARAAFKASGRAGEDKAAAVAEAARALAEREASLAAAVRAAHAWRTKTNEDQRRLDAASQELRGEAQDAAAHRRWSAEEARQKAALTVFDQAADDCPDLIKGDAVAELLRAVMDMDSTPASGATSRPLPPQAHGPGSPSQEPAARRDGDGGLSPPPPLSRRPNASPSVAAAVAEAAAAAAAARAAGAKGKGGSFSDLTVRRRASAEPAGDGGGGGGVAAARRARRHSLSDVSPSPVPGLRELQLPPSASPAPAPAHRSDAGLKREGEVFAWEVKHGVGFAGLSARRLLEGNDEAAASAAAAAAEAEDLAAAAAAARGGGGDEAGDAKAEERPPALLEVVDKPAAPPRGLSKTLGRSVSARVSARLVMAFAAAAAAVFVVVVLLFAVHAI